MAPSPSAIRLVGYVMIVSGIDAAVRLWSFPVALSRDTGQLLYGGMVVLHGGVPYRDAALNKGPVTYLGSAVLALLVGHSAVAVRLVLFVCSVAAVLALTFYLREMAGVRVAWVGGLVLAVFSAIGVFEGADPNLEQFSLAFMAITLWLSARDGAPCSALTGAGAACVGLSSPDLLLPLLPAVIVTMWSRRRGLSQYLVALGAGVIVAAAVFLWLFLAGALPDFFTQVGGAWGGYPHGGLFLIGRLVAVPARGLWLVSIGGGLLALTRRELRAPAVVALLWILAVWVRVKLGDYLADDPQYPQHYYVALLGMSAALGLGLGAIAPVAVRWQILAGLAALIPLVVSLVIVPEVDALRVPVLKRGVGGYPFAFAYPVARFVDSHTTPGQRIYVVGSQPEVYWLADRFAATRFFDIYPVLAHPAYNSQRLATLRRHPAAAIINMPSWPGIDPPLRHVMNEVGYRHVYSTVNGQIWLRKNP